VCKQFEAAVTTMANQLKGDAGDIPDCQVMLISNAESDPVRQLDVRFLFLELGNTDFLNHATK
jgi:hypothetical protein